MRPLLPASYTMVHNNKNAKQDLEASCKTAARELKKNRKINISRHENVEYCISTPQSALAKPLTTAQYQ